MVIAISTHTLTWSVTNSFNRICSVYIISTHTLTWSVTRMLSVQRWSVYNFNSHAHVERDVYIYNYVSWTYHFNSHAHVERDTIQPYRKRIWQHFNSHAHVERDGGEIQLRDQDGNFNSHAHVERDFQNYCTHVQVYISTHTLTWSVTELCKIHSLVCDISTHTLTWSVTTFTINGYRRTEFQLTRSRGA